MARDGEPPPVPVTLLAGFLGSGKTTLANRILSEEHGQRIAVIVNEFGDVGVDGRLVVGSDDDVVELRNGCICCSVAGELSETLRGLLRKRRRRFVGALRFERILIEASGLASPGPAVQTLRIDPELGEATLPPTVVTLVHAARIREQLAEHPEAGEQVGYADRLLVNHCDRADEAELRAVEAALRACNADAPLHRTTRAAIDVATLLADAPAAFPRQPPAGDAAPHTCGVGTVSLATREPLDLHRLKMWLQFLCNRRTHDLMRVKGVVRCADHAPAVVVQGVYQWLEVGPGPMQPPDESVLVLIGRDLDREELERGWRTCRSGEGGGP